MKKAYIALGSRFGEERVLNNYGFEVVDTLAECDFVVFTGGADINPALYNEQPHRTTGFYEKRDEGEIAVYKAAVVQGKAFLGICRGAQLLNVLVGGSLFQDVDNHCGGDHAITTDCGKTFLTTSVHHQMMRVNEAEGAVIKAWADHRASRREHTVDGKPVDCGPGIDPEIVTYAKHRMVLVQGHPEFSYTNPELHELRQYVFDLLKGI